MEPLDDGLDPALEPLLDPGREIGTFLCLEVGLVKGTLSGLIISGTGLASSTGLTSEVLKQI